MSRQGAAKRPYEEFVDDAYSTLAAEVTTFASTRMPGGLPAGFDVSDFVHHGLAALLEPYDRLENEAVAYTYARTSAMNALRDAAGVARRRQLPEWLAGVAARHGGTGHTPDETAEHLSRRRDVEVALDRLPDRQRQAVRLLYMEGFTRIEAAKIMGTTPTTVKSLAQRARATLASVLRGAPTLGGVCLAVQTALRKVRRPVAATGAVAPRLAVALCLTVAQQPAVRLPAAGAYGSPVAHTDRPRVVAGPRLVRQAQALPRPARAGQRPSTPARLVTPRAPVRPLIPRPKKASPPKAGGCVEGTCVGDLKIGDELCLDHERQEHDPLCANQDVLGVCPTAEQLAVPRTRCTRHSEPTFDP